MIIIDNIFSAKEKDIYAQAFLANCEFLGISDWIARPEFGIRLSKEVLSEGTEGCTASPRGFEQPTAFRVALNSVKYNLPNHLSVFGHEMIHIRQFLKGQMKSLPDNGTWWKNQTFPASADNPDGDFDRMPPWEKEAHGNQLQVFANVLHHLPRKLSEELMDAATPDVLPYLMWKQKKFLHTTKYLQAFVEEK